ncbi:MAG: SPOR domain-containing protein [Candidatus Methylopumilus sp.]|nr:SPOR domain-containing protein [Candidatus Methylopumilus sp.]
MNQDYKSNTQKASIGSKGNPFLTGLIVGVLLGVAISVVFTIYIKGGTSAFTTKTDSAIAIDPNDGEITKEASENAEPAKPRFEFYNILQGNEPKVTEQEIKQIEGEDRKPLESYFLQVGAFRTEQEADNMKAKMALIGLEAIVEPVSLEDKGVLHRVRVGPFVDMAQVNKAKAELKENGFSADIKKVNTP